jgi:hypothetical protein
MFQYQKKLKLPVGEIGPIEFKNMCYVFVR